MNKINQNTKNKKRKNRKIDFLFVSEYCATIWARKWKQPFLRGGGGGGGSAYPQLEWRGGEICMLLNRTEPKKNGAKTEHLSDTKLHR